jgi:hypothetical protein
MTKLENHMIEKIDGAYVRVGECALRDAGTRELLKVAMDEGRASCLTATARDAETQRHIDSLVTEITRRAAETIVRDDRILTKIDELLKMQNTKGRG